MKKIIPAFLMAALAPACSYSEQNPAAKARQALISEDLRTARIQLIAALDHDGETVTLLTLLANVQLRLGDGYGAEHTSGRLARIGYSEPELRQIRSEAALLRGDPRTAITLLGDDPSPNALRVRAAAKFALQDDVGALQALQKGASISADPQLLRDYIKALIQAQRVKEAQLEWNRLAAISPEGLQTLLSAGEIALQSGNLSRAHQVLVKAAQLYPRAPEPWITRSMAFDAEGKLADAISAAKQARSIAPEDPRVTDLEIQYSAMTGDWSKVRATLEGSNGSLEPGSANGLSYAEALLRLGQPQLARAWFRRALDRSPSNPFARMMLAESELACGEAEAAAATIKPLIETALAGDRELKLALAIAVAAHRDTSRLRDRIANLSNNRDLALDRKAQSAMRAGDWRTAATAYTELAENGDDAEVLRRLAFALTQAGRTDEAIAVADRAHALRPDSPDMIYISGYVRCAGKREADKGLRLLEQASNAAPADTGIRKSLAFFRAQSPH